MKPSLFVLLLAAPAFAQVVPWTTQTTPIPSLQAGDPALVVVGNDALLVGTDTAQVGAYVYGLDGALRQVVPVGIVRGADAREWMVVITSPFSGVLSFAAEDAGLTRLAPQSLSVPSPANLALSAPDGGVELWVDTQSLMLRHFVSGLPLDGGFSFTELAPVALPQPPSGLVVDDRTGRLYVAQPTLGVLRLEADGTQEFLLSIDAGELGARVGGLALLHALDGGAVLFSTSSPDNAVVLHTVAGTQATFGARLQLGQPDGGAARVQLPQFLDVYDQPLPGFPRGVLAVQDTTGGNYKLVSLDDVHAVFPLPPAFLTPPDAGTDGGTGGPDGGGTGIGAGGGSGTSRPPPSAAPLPTSCGCTGGPFALLPALLLLLSTRRSRSRN